MTPTDNRTCRAHFDYEQMAEEARRERDSLSSIVKARRRQRPKNPDKAMLWEQQSKRYYEMYLEQRKNAIEFEHRARKRRAYGS